METKVIKEIQDLTYLSWDRIRNSSGTAGSFLKAYSDLEDKKIYYKLSNYDAFRGIVGHECVNEIIVDRLLTILGIEHLHYQLLHAQVLLDHKIYTTYLSASVDFKEAGESKVALDNYYQLERMEEESPLEFCVRNGWEDYIYQMLVVDFLILNRDRHGANIEILRNNKKKTVRLAPLFDHGLSLIFHCQQEEDVKHFDVLQDRAVQSFVGSRSAMDNLHLIPRDRIPELRRLERTDREKIFLDLETIIPELWQDKIWEMIWKRWEVYESFCNQG